MTRAHAARQLLALGPLTPREFREITRWPADACRNVIRWLAASRQIRRVSGGRWGLA